MDTTNILGLSGFAISILGILYTAVNHKRVRSRCCGKSFDVSVDVENTTPPRPLEIKSPEENLRHL
jgi:hypothetical protein